METWVNIGSVRVNLTALRAEDVVLEDVARSLSRLNRFLGRTRVAYSVAEHSVRASYLCSEEHALATLLHDVTESFIGDVITPVKRQAPEIMAMERVMETQLERHFGLRAGALSHPAVKAADVAALHAEAHALTVRCDWCPEPAPEVAARFRGLGWGERRAYRRFLARFDELSGAGARRRWAVFR